MSVTKTKQKTFSIYVSGKSHSGKNAKKVTNVKQNLDLHEIYLKPICEIWAWRKPWREGGSFQKSLTRNLLLNLNPKHYDYVSETSFKVKTPGPEITKYQKFAQFLKVDLWQNVLYSNSKPAWWNCGSRSMSLHMSLWKQVYEFTYEV